MLRCSAPKPFLCLIGYKGCGALRLKNVFRSAEAPASVIAVFLSFTKGHSLITID